MGGQLGGSWLKEKISIEGDSQAVGEGTAEPKHGDGNVPNLRKQREQTLEKGGVLTSFGRLSNTDRATQHLPVTCYRAPAAGQTPCWDPQGI